MIEMRQQFALRHGFETLGQRLAMPAALLGSLFVIALMLYAIDATALRTIVLSP
jgi:hypothetical protein